MTTAYEIVKKLLEANECLRMVYDKGLDKDPQWLPDIVRLKVDMTAACYWLDKATGIHSTKQQLYDFYIQYVDPRFAVVEKIDNYVKEEFDVK